MNDSYNQYIKHRQSHNHSAFDRYILSTGSDIMENYADSHVKMLHKFNTSNAIETEVETHIRDIITSLNLQTPAALCTINSADKKQFALVFSITLRYTLSVTADLVRQKNLITDILNLKM